MLIPQTFIEHLLCALTVPVGGATMATDAALPLVLLKCRMQRETQSGKHTKHVAGLPEKGKGITTGVIRESP